MNILSSRRNSASNESTSNQNLSRRTNLGVNSQTNYPPTSRAPSSVNLPSPNNSTPSINSSLLASSRVSNSISPDSGISPTSGISPANSITPASGVGTASSINPSSNTPYLSPNLLSNYTATPITGSGLLPELVEVTLYSPQIQNIEESIEDVAVSPNINVLSNSSSVHIYRSLNTEFESCTICRENFNPNSIVRRINGCGHVFHINCIDTWFESNITCPVCRIDLRDAISNTDDEMEDAEETEINDDSEVL